MHLYWKVFEELKYLGETWIIHDPSLLRRYKEWTFKNADFISGEFHETPSEPSPIFEHKGIPHSLN